MAVDAIITARKGHAVLPDGSIGAPIQTGNREPRTLLTGVLRCGKPKPDGSICNVLMRTNTYYRSNTHVYTCPGKTQGGCGGVARNGPRTDQYVSEAVLAKLDERQAMAPDSVTWLGAPGLDRAQQKLGMLTRQWQEDHISDGLYFANLEKLEGRIRELTNERNRHAAAAQRALADVADVRRRWFISVEDGGLDLSADVTERRTIVNNRFFGQSEIKALSWPVVERSVATLNPVVGMPAPAGFDLRTSDYQKLLPKSAGHVWKFRLASADVSGWCVLLLDVGDCFG
jgi:hypothetical protein